MPRRKKTKREDLIREVLEAKTQPKQKKEALLENPWDVKPWTKKGSPYWSWSGASKTNDAEGVVEPKRANPDVLQSDETSWQPWLSAAQRRQLEAIEDSFDVLSDLERRVISLIYVEGIGQKEIAEKLSLTQQMVSKALKSARFKIRTIEKYK